MLSRHGCQLGNVNHAKCGPDLPPRAGTFLPVDYPQGKDQTVPALKTVNRDMSYDPPQRRLPPRQGGWPQATPPRPWRADREDGAYPDGNAYRDADQAQPSYQAQAAYQGQPAYQAQPSYQAQAAYQGQPAYQAQPAYQGQAANQAQPSYQAQLASQVQPAYQAQLANQAQPAYQDEPAYQDAFDGSADPGYRGYRQTSVADPLATGTGGYAYGRASQDGPAEYYGEPADGFDGAGTGYGGAAIGYAGAADGFGSARAGYGGAGNGYGVAADGFDGADNGYGGNGYRAPDDYTDHRNGHGWSGNGSGDRFTGPQDSFAGPAGYLSPDDYAEPAYAQAGYAQPGYDEPGYAQPGYSEPGYAQPGYSEPGYAQPGYSEPDYAQPAYAQAAYDEPDYGEADYSEADYAGRESSGSALMAPDADMLPHRWVADRDRRREAGRRGLIVGAVTGLLAAAVAIGVATLEAAFVGRQASPVIIVGNAFIDRVPAALKTMAADHFGQHGRTVLLLGMYVMIAIVAMAIGVLTRHAPALGVAAIAVFGLFGAFVAITRPQGQLTDVLPSVLGAFAGAIALLWLRHASAPVAPLRPAHGGGYYRGA
jgi:hypothetical protein